MPRGNVNYEDIIEAAAMRRGIVLPQNWRDDFAAVSVSQAEAEEYKQDQICQVVIGKKDRVEQCPPVPFLRVVKYLEGVEACR